MSEASAPISQDGNLYPKLYPELSQYMGLSLNEEEVRANMAVVSGAPVQGVCIINDVKLILNYIKSWFACRYKLYFLWLTPTFITLALTSQEF